MKITKERLKEIIKEELEVTLTNEEAGEMFGEGVEAELETIAQALGKIAMETGIPATIMTAGAMATEYLNQQKQKVGAKALKDRRAGKLDASYEIPALPPMSK